MLDLVAPATRGDPERPLLWSSKSLRNLATELRAQEHPVSERTVSKLLKQAGYSLQSPRKVHEGKADHPDRDAQFQFIARQRASFQEAGQPTISVDTKKKLRHEGPRMEWARRLEAWILSGTHPRFVLKT